MGSIGSPKQVTKLFIWVQKKDDMTHDEFVDYWVNVHGKLFLEFPIVKKHCLKYEQYHEIPGERTRGEAAFDLPASGWDGLAVLSFDSVEDAHAVYHDADFGKFAVEDEPMFCKYPNVSKRMVVIGQPHVAYERKV